MEYFCIGSIGVHFGNPGTAPVVRRKFMGAADYLFK